MIVQVAEKDRAAITESEAFGDMQAQIGDLKSRRPDVHFAILREDASHFLKGIARAASTRTIFIGRQGRALVFDGLFVDDPKPVEDFFDGHPDAQIPPEELAVTKLEFRSGACVN